MTTATVTHAPPIAAPKTAEWSSAWQVWGAILIAPYVLVFLLFVLYPVGYGFWLARAPQSYVELFDDPIFMRSIVNTLMFLHRRRQSEDVDRAVAVGLLHAEPLAGSAGCSLLFILPWAVPSIPTILSFRFMLNPEWGIVNQLIFRLTGEDGPNWLNDPRSALTLRDRRPYLEVAAVLDADPDLRAGSRSRATSTRPPPSTAQRAGRNSASSPGRRCRPSI